MTDKTHIQGFSVDTAVGTATFPVNLTGQRGRLKGIAVRGGTAGDTINLSLNNEKLIEDVEKTFLEKDASNPTPYFAISRPISGSDNWRLTINSTTAGVAAFVTIWYEDATL